MGSKLVLKNLQQEEFTITHPDGVGALQLNSTDIASSKAVDTIAQLKLIDGANVDRLNVLGYYAKGDGGGGLFYWDGASTEADNGGTIIQAIGIATGRWKRVYSGAINAKWFGAKGDGVTDDTVAIQNAVNASVNSSLYISSGNYLIIESIKVPSNTKISGDGWSEIESKAGWYEGYPKLNTGTSIISKSQWACFELVGTSSNKITRCIIRDIELWHYPATNPNTTFADNKPLYTTSTAITSHYGDGHKIQNIRTARFGYAGIELGINRTYNGILYNSLDYSGGKGSNNHISDFYGSQNFGPSLLVFSEQTHITNCESDGYYLPDNGGFINPNTSTKMLGGLFAFNTVGLFVVNCHFEQHKDRGYGIYINRLNSTGTYCEQINISNSKIYGGITGLYIGDGVLGSSISNINFSGNFGLLSSDLRGKCIFSNNVLNGLNNDNSRISLSNQDSQITNCLFKDCSKAIEITYRGQVKNCTFSNCVVGVFISASSMQSLVLDNNFNCIYSFDLPILNSTYINDSTLGICTIGELNGSYTHRITATKTLTAGGSKDLIKIVPNVTTTYKTQITKVTISSIFDGLQGSSAFNTVDSVVHCTVGIYYDGGSYLTYKNNVDTVESNYAITTFGQVCSITNSTNQSIFAVKNYDATNAHFVQNIIDISGRYYGFYVL